MKYTRANYKRDLRNPEMPHIKDYEHYVAFYEELGKGLEQKYQQFRWNQMQFIEPVGDILELGCHSGFNLVHYASLGYKITGVDISSTLLNNAKERIQLYKPEIGRRIKLIHSDILNLNDLGKYDTIILTEVLEHVINPTAILKKTVEYMKPTSKLYVSAPRMRIGNYSHVRGISPEWLIQEGKKIGIYFLLVSAKMNTKAIGTLI